MSEIEQPTSTVSTAHLSDEQIMDMYDKAQKAAPFLSLVFSMHQGRTLVAFQQAGLRDVDKIMELKAIDCGFAQIQRDFTGITQHAERIFAERARANDPAEKEKKRIDKLGFGLK